jgi:hypothetical protein
MFFRRVFAVLFSLCITISAEEKQLNNQSVVYPVSILWPGRVSYPTTPARAGFILDISTDLDAKDYFPADQLVLKLLKHPSDKVPTASMKFESSYGFFDLSLVDVTGDGVEEFFLVTGEGHGTHARSETLNVLMRRGKVFQSILKIPVSSPCGGSCDWEYERQFADINGDGIIDLRLVRKITGNLDRGDHKYIPKDEVREYIYNKATDKMERTK